MRPILNRDISSKDFENNYWLKEELIEFCRSHELPASGSKGNLEEVIKYFLDTGNKLQVKKKVSFKADRFKITLDSVIPDRYKNDENHRTFFRSVIGDKFKFNVTFMNWMKDNSGKTYKEAVDHWFYIDKERKKGIKREISSQFEYNQYTRDFFKDNPERNREECIKCWKYKKSVPGSNRYERSDLNCL